ncbi:MAG: RNA polymerase Rpb4 family protein [Candidatus Pacearchaeota archaeon]
MKIIKKTPISLAEVKEILAKEKKEENKKVEQVLDYVNKFAKLSAENARKLMEELKTLQIVKLDEEYIVKIVDILPEDADDVRKIFVGSSISLNQDEIQKILEIVAKYKK